MRRTQSEEDLTLQLCEVLKHKERQRKSLLLVPLMESALAMISWFHGRKRP